MRVFSLLLLVLLLTGCASKTQRIGQRAANDYYLGQFAQAVERLRPVAEETDENFVLNNVRLGSAALASYDLEQAEAALLRAYEVMNSFGVNKGGRTLGAVLVDEKIKIWKGEPFERAMANFYLGLVYYMEQDYNNARAAFENALFRLRDYGDKEAREDEFREVESNFALASLMLGKSWLHVGREDLAEANFARVRELRRDLAPLADVELNRRSNLLLVVDYGYGPQKLTDFDGSVIRFSPTPAEVGLVPEPQVTVDGQPVPVESINQPTIDLLAMAQDRRWQGIDTLRAIKSGVGTGLIAGGAAYGAHRANTGKFNDEDLAISAALIGAGLLFKATSQADVRQWEMLPRSVFVLPLHVPPGTHDITIDFPHAPGQRQTWQNIVVPTEGEATYYIRMQRWNSAVHTWPPPALADAE